MSLKASGILDPFTSKYDLRSLFEVIVPKFAFPDDNDDDNDDNDDQGGDGQGSGEGNDTGDGDQSGSAGKDDIKDPEKKRLSDENASWRRKYRDLEKEKQTWENEKRSQEDKNKSDLEIAQRDLKEATEERDTLRVTTKQQARTLALYQSGAANQFNDVSDAEKFLDISDLEPDEDGNLDQKEIKDRVDRLLKEKPYLKRADNSDDGDDSDNNQQSSGRPANGKRQKGGGNTREELAKKFPALNTR